MNLNFGKNISKNFTMLNNQQQMHIKLLQMDQFKKQDELFTRYLLLFTFYSLLFTFFSLLVTFYSLFVNFYSLILSHLEVQIRGNFLTGHKFANSLKSVSEIFDILAFLITRKVSEAVQLQPRLQDSFLPQLCSTCLIHSM